MSAKEKLEDYVADVFDSLLNLRNEGIVVSRNAILRGKSGADHEIDVYYEFLKAGVTHKVAIECKNRGRPIEKKEIHDFWCKLQDIGQIKGIVVSQSGLQSGAQLVADFKDMDFMTPDELPSIGMLLGNKLAAVALPDETYVGEPFWTLMETRGGKVTGSYYGASGSDGSRSIALLFSRKEAERYLADMDIRNFCVRGLPQICLRAVLIMAYGLNWRFSIIYGKHDGAWRGGGFGPRQIQDEYYLKPDEDLTPKR
jgi:hypothetical protein